MFWYMYSEALCCKSLILNDFLKLAEWTGLEPATPGVTGRYSNQLNYHSRLIGELLAEVVRFELTDDFSSAVFKTAGLNHSPKLP